MKTNEILVPKTYRLDIFFNVSVWSAEKGRMSRHSLQRFVSSTPGQVPIYTTSNEDLEQHKVSEREFWTIFDWLRVKLSGDVVVISQEDAKFIEDFAFQAEVPLARNHEHDLKLSARKIRSLLSEKLSNSN